MNIFGIPQQHMSNWGDALTAKNKPWATTPEYHQWGTQDLVEQKSKELSAIPYIGDVAAVAFEKVAPALALGASPIYDTAQAFSKYNENPGKYETNNKWDKVNAYFPGLEGTTTAGILNAIDQEDILSAAYNRMIGAGKAGMESKINRQNQLQSLLGKGWDAIKNEFGGSAEAAEMPRPINRFGNTVAPNIPMGEDTSDLSGIAEVREPTQINNPYQTYMHPYDDVDRWTADEDMTYQPDVKSNRFSGLTNPVKKGAGVLMSGLMKIPGAGLFLDAVQPASPELRAQADAVTAADKNNLMAGKNMISMFGTNDPEQMILDRINKIKNRKADQTDFSRKRIAELQLLAEEANRAKHSASADLGGGWTRQNRPGGAATFTGPGGQTHQGWSNTAAGTRAAAASEASFARGGYTRSRYNTGGRVGILAAF